MASYEGDELPFNSPADLSPGVRDAFWRMFDIYRYRRFYLKWGWFRVSFKLEVLEPLFIKLIGARP